MITPLMAISVIVGAPPAANADCPIAEAHFTSGRIDNGDGKGFHRLDEEPRPNAYRAVARRIGRCNAPVVLHSRLTQQR